jgi:hypothetical protein
VLVGEILRDVSLSWSHEPRQPMICVELRISATLEVESGSQTRLHVGAKPTRSRWTQIFAGRQALDGFSKWVGVSLKKVLSWG